MEVFHPSGETGELIINQIAEVPSNASINGVGNVLRVVNIHASRLAYVKVGIGAQVASAADLPVRPGELQYIQIDYADDNVGGWSGTTVGEGSQIRFTRGTVR